MDSVFRDDESRRDGTSIAGKLFARFSWQLILWMLVDIQTGWIGPRSSNPSNLVEISFLGFRAYVAGTIPDFWKGDEVSQSVVAGRFTFIESGDVHTRRVRDGVVLTGLERPIAFTKAVASLTRECLTQRHLAKYGCVSCATSRDADCGCRGGGSAGAIIAWLASVHAESDISIISLCSRALFCPVGTGFRSASGLLIQRVGQLPLNDRRFLLSHTEEGVISLRNKTR